MVGILCGLTEFKKACRNFNQNDFKNLIKHNKGIAKREIVISSHNAECEKMVLVIEVTKGFIFELPPLKPAEF